MNTDKIHTNVMLVELRVSQWTARKQDKRVAEAVAAANHVDQHVGSYYKSLIDPQILKRIMQVVNEMRKEYYKHTLPWSDEGPRILPADMYFDFMETMSGFRVKFEGMVKEFLKDYPYHREEAKRFLGNLFNDDDYPEPDKLANKFGFSLSVRPLPHSSDFRCDIGSEEVERVRQQIEEQTKATLQQSVKAAFDRILEVASRYADRLATDDGIFRDSMVESARELAEIMPKLNFTGDPELERLTQVVKDKLAVHDPAVLRTNMGVRREAAAAAKSVVSDIENVFGGGTL